MEFAVACTRKVSIRVGTVCGSCKHWRRERGITNMCEDKT